ncbi:unnamed protein product [Protopolystoma xenopodis]|uniref:Protein Wnt n=1 Tax=Protopolystoma xenopodis TaxID=117903 RepID=A0A448WUJ7_9PLAT|nr:unnamed protein product [Protopolystoma xenopodis]
MPRSEQRLQRFSSFRRIGNQLKTSYQSAFRVHYAWVPWRQPEAGTRARASSGPLGDTAYPPINGLASPRRRPRPADFGLGSSPGLVPSAGDDWTEAAGDVGASLRRRGRRQPPRGPVTLPSQDDIVHMEESPNYCNYDRSSGEWR